jgi:uncharacterized hydrophobic protein (TIGR00271 family)
MILGKWIRPLTTARRTEVLEQLSRDSSPGFDFFLLVFLSSSIATFGLITNSGAVIIGAMLIAPLMSPIIALSLASIQGEGRIFRRAVMALLEGAALAILLSALLAWIAKILPFGFLVELPAEIIARIRLSPLDVGIALAGGAAAAYALAQPHLSAALPGVAIATALMPPLCDVGIGIAIGRWDITMGALLLFLTNLASISFAGIMVSAALGFRPRYRAEAERHISRSMITSALLVLAVTFPLIVLSLRAVSEANLARQVREAVENHIDLLDNADLVEFTYEQVGTQLNLEITIRSSDEPTHEELVGLQSSIATYHQHPVSLRLQYVPSTELDPLIPPTFTNTPLPNPSDTSSPTSTYTPSPSSKHTPVPTNTSTPTTTPSSTPTETSTPTNTLTPTPVLAFIIYTGDEGVYLRETPNGHTMPGPLPGGSPVGILYDRVIINHVEWIYIRDVIGREGWVRASYLVIRP